MKKYETYIFDLYGTLVDIHTDEDDEKVWEKLALFYGYYGAAYKPAELSSAFRKLIDEHEAKMKEESEKNQCEKADDYEAFPEIAVEQVFLELFDKKGIKADMPLAVHTGQFFRALTTEYIRLYDGAEELLLKLKKVGGRLYLLSNAQRIFTEYELHMLGIDRYFDDVFISSSYGVKKPDIRFFRALLEKHRVDTSKAIMIGNDINSDIKGAKQVGLSTFYIHSNLSSEFKSKPKADIILPFMDLKAVLKTLL